MSTTTTIGYQTLPTKKEILERLLKAEQITFDEMWVLLQEDPLIRYVIMPQQPVPYGVPNPWFGILPPYQPSLPYFPQIDVTCQSK